MSFVSEIFSSSIHIHQLRLNMYWVRVTKKHDTCLVSGVKGFRSVYTHLYQSVSANQQKCKIGNTVFIRYTSRRVEDTTVLQTMTMILLLYLLIKDWMILKMYAKVCISQFHLITDNLQMAPPQYSQFHLIRDNSQTRHPQYRRKVREPRIQYCRG